ncbi:hypothetical protein [Brachybacterium phenoliresistens]|uniref:hypothetical protein n=1 Tax=Brachybacterium phenoliresistens TaxID=396014 RepID=UPI0031DBADD7
MARELKPCGTTAAYKRHRRRDEEACDACKRAVRDEKRARRAATLAEQAEILNAEDAPVRARLAELRWQAELLRDSIVWATTNSPARLPSLMKERRETLAEIERIDDGDESQEGGGLGEFLSGSHSGPLSLVGSPAPSDRKEA